MRKRKIKDWFLDRFDNSRGLCRARPKEGGYGHWRCMLRLGHRSPHRFNNYVWDRKSRTRYAPLNPIRHDPLPGRKLKRSM